MGENEQLQELRVKLVNELGEVADSDLIDPIQRFSLAMLKAQNSNHIEDLNRAATIAHAIEDPEAKTDALLQLIDEIDFQLLDSEVPESVEPEEQQSTT
jgi:hypothetical protein